MNGIPILMYHEISDKNKCRRISVKTQYANIIDKELFERHIEYLYVNKFRCLNVEDLILLLKNSNINNEDLNKCIVITFDDGYEGNYYYAYPVLKKYGFKGTIFLISNKIGREYMLSGSQIREMQKNDIFFGSHTIKHSLLGVIKNKNIYDELQGSKKTIEDVIGKEIKYLSLPHGSYRKGYDVIAKLAGYEGGLTSDPGINTKKVDAFYLKRNGIYRNSSLNYFKSICEKRKFLLLRITIKKTLIRRIKKFIGEEKYLCMYNRIYGVREDYSSGNFE